MDSGGSVRPPANPEDEALRRNTDCIYFLASPLTCKKGSECEYRHSEAARVNHRDCWYWFNGNCLNPKCSFRHPPLDDLFGAPAIPRTAQPPAPALQASVSAQAPVSASANGVAKQSVPCYYYQKSSCLKGDSCPFMHGPQAASNPAPNQPAKVAASLNVRTQTQVKNSWTLKACTQQNLSAQQSKPAAIIDKPKTNGLKLVDVPPISPKPAASYGLPNGVLPRKQHSSTLDDDTSAYQNHLLVENNSYKNSRREKYRAQPSYDPPYSGRGVGEFVREPSHVLDVPAAKVDEDPVWFHNEDDYGHLHTGGESVTRHKSELQGRMHSQIHNSHGYEQPHKIPAERDMDSGIRFSERESIHADTNRSDLRHQLLKRRRLNDSRLSRSPDAHYEPYRREEDYVQERLHGYHSLRDEQQFPREGTISSRLHGRIQLPGRMSPPDRVGFWARGPRDMFPPPGLGNFQGRFHNRRRLGPYEEIVGVANSFRQRSNKRDDLFSTLARPRRLAELRGTKVFEGSQVQSSPRVRSSIVANPDSSLQFDGPKPLSVIRKRKIASASDGAAHSDSGQKEDPEREGESVVDFNSSMGAPGEQSIGSMTLGKGENELTCPQNDEAGINEEEEVEDGEFDDEGGDKEPAARFSATAEVTKTVDGVNNNLEDQGREHEEDPSAEPYDDGADNMDEDIVYEEYEDEFDDDDDDFARKIGVMFS